MKRHYEAVPPYFINSILDNRFKAPRDNGELLPVVGTYFLFTNFLVFRYCAVISCSQVELF